MITWNGTQLLTDINKNIDAEGMRIAQLIQDKARAYAPYETGYLRNTIDAFYDAVAKSIEIYVGAEYGIFQEYGTRYMMAHPYLRPALNEVGQIYGFEVTMAFTNTFATDTKLLAHGGGFQMHKSLTAGQKEHVRKNLKPVSQFYHQEGQSNVGRAKLKVKTRKF